MFKTVRQLVMVQFLPVENQGRVLILYDLNLSSYLSDELKWALR